MTRRLLGLVLMVLGTGVVLLGGLAALTAVVGVEMFSYGGVSFPLYILAYVVFPVVVGLGLLMLGRRWRQRGGR